MSARRQSSAISKTDPRRPRAAKMCNVDLLRTAAGARRPARWWDRGLWLCGLVLALLCLSIGLWSQAALALGDTVGAQVTHCHTGLHVDGRFINHVTSCDVQINGGAFAGRHTVESSTRHAPGSTIELAAFRHTLSDRGLISSRALLIPLGVLIFAATWWMGFPLRKADRRVMRTRHSRRRHRH
jgi:hypothetical protein